MNCDSLFRGFWRESGLEKGRMNRTGGGKIMQRSVHTVRTIEGKVRGVKKRTQNGKKMTHWYNRVASGFL